MVDIWTALQARVRANGGAPLVTYVDPATGERTELSATSTANAAAKIANALRDEFALLPGDIVVLDLPPHWQRSMWCAGAWTAGCVVMPQSAPDAHVAALVVTTTERAAVWSTGAARVVAVSMHPFGLPITEPLPHDVDDATLLVRQQPDAYLFDPPTEALPALQGEGRAWTQGELMTAASDLGLACGLASGGRLLLLEDAGFAEDWLGGLPVPLALSASVVIMRGSAGADRVAEQERTTALLPQRD